LILQTDPTIVAMENLVMNFDEAQTVRLKTLIQQIEQRTGARLMSIMIDRSDSYPEIAWKAFAALICVHALIQLIHAIFPPDRIIAWSEPSTIGFILGTSASVALLTQLWPPFGRLFLGRPHAEKMTRQHADSLFLNREVFRTPGRTGILLLVSLFERQVVLLPDSGIADNLDQNARQQVIDRMIPLLRREDPFQAIAQGLAHLEIVLPATGTRPSLNGEAPAPDPGPIEVS
jgi:putative membrane protein